MPIKLLNILTYEFRRIIMKVMFVCTGNICRSAMAEAMFKKILEERNINNIEVCSCCLLYTSRCV